MRNFKRVETKPVKNTVSDEKSDDTLEQPSEVKADAKAEAVETLEEITNG